MYRQNKTQVTASGVVIAEHANLTVVGFVS